MGPILTFIIYLLSSDLLPNQRIFLSIFSFVIYQWIFSSIPLYITGLLGIASCIILNLASAKVLFASFGSPIIFLFLGGFLLAKAFNNVGLDKRISLFLLTRNWVNGSLTKLLFLLMSLTAVFSMWISNTATTAMMLPLTLGTLKSLKIEDKKAIGLILICIAYSASIGGVATPIGSTPNIVAIGMLDEFLNIKVNFLGWMKLGLPASILFFSILFITAKFKLKNIKQDINNEHLCNEYKKLPTPSIFELYTFLCFLLAVILWLVPSILKLFNYTIPLGLNTGAVAIFCATLLFVFPLRTGRKVLINNDLKDIDWGSLLLFGSGLALGKILFDLKLANMAGAFLIQSVQGFHLWFVIFILILFVLMSTELSSNTASANIIIPIVLAMANELGLDPTYLALGIGITCSLAFMLPVATPPNAIVYGSQMVEKVQMAKTGFILHCIFSLVISTGIYLLIS